MDEYEQELMGKKEKNWFQVFLESKNMQSIGHTAIMLGACVLALYFGLNLEKVDPLYMLGIALLYLGIVIRLK